MTARQQRLFESQETPWEADDAGWQWVATVVFSRGPQRPFDYLVPDELRGSLTVGQRVRAPFGKQDRVVTGYCVGLENQQPDSRRLKPLQSVVDARSLLSPAMIRLAEWMSDYYLCSLGQVLEAILPAGVRTSEGGREARFVWLSEQLVHKRQELKLSPTQARVVDFLATRKEPTTAQQVATAVGCTMGPIRTMCKRGLLETELKRVQHEDDQTASDLPPDGHLKLNSDQRAALDVILRTLAAGEHSTVLVHGVTGSGKTEVYIQAIEEVISYGRQAIVLVPEISLTPQAESRFRSRFGNVAVLHSHLTDSQRRKHWERIAAGGVRVIVGARSAVFAPAPSLGLIVLDEEHETSFKQDTNPRYHARDVALERARGLGIPLVLGSATPSLESYQRAIAGEYQMVSMPRRVFDRPMPAVGTIDLRLEFQDRRNRGAISRQLKLAMDESLNKGGQVILLLNRRGYSTHIQCPSCGLVFECPNCAIALTHHLQEQLAVCHYCDYRAPAPGECPRCQFVGIQYRGLGTQRLEAEVQARFPKHRCLRMDTDTMRRPGSHEAALSQFRDGAVRILVGTQMIAKGLDFPNVTLVGVINADIALHLADFRAAERTFQLVTQVAGRTGRGDQGGRVLVQTFNPEHPAIAAAIHHDYDAFATRELPLRQAHAYPPFSSMIRIVVRGPEERISGEFADQIALNLRAAMAKAPFTWRVLGPAPAPIAKLRGQHRFQIQIQGLDGRALKSVVREVTADLKPPELVQWMADIDPYDML